jgi:hypothetical protein
VRGLRVAGVPEGFDEGGEGGMGTALEVEHASTSGERPSDMERVAPLYVTRL